MIVLRRKYPVQSWEVEYVEYPSGVLGKDIPIPERHGGTAILTTPGCLHLEMCDAGCYGHQAGQLIDMKSAEKIDGTRGLKDNVLKPANPL